VVVLGDSFVDGFGVESEDRMTNVAESLSGFEFLNFGVSGNFGPIQTWLLYRETASHFDHDQVHIFLFPYNDFDDNDPSNFPSTRYRPYLKKLDSDNYQLYYTTPFTSETVEQELSRSEVWSRHLYNNIYFLNAILQVKNLIQGSNIKYKISNRTKLQFESSYNIYSTEQFELLEYVYGEIITLAGNRPVKIFVIPTDNDIIKHRGDQTSRLIADLNKFASRFDNVAIYDLLPVFADYALRNELRIESFFIPATVTGLR
jgi:hypothetical protein